MPFVNDILRYDSLSIVGLEKNTGKTVCLNYILRRLNNLHISVGVTSIGVDGEQTDAVFATAKPEVTLYEGSRFITSEQHYLRRQLVSIVESVDSRRTALGPLVTARVLVRGKALLSGAASTGVLRSQIAALHNSGCRLAIVDGALSRISLASPTVTDAMVLATGAAVSANIKQIIARTRFFYDLIRLDETPAALAARLSPITSGLWALGDDGTPVDLGIPSVFLIDRSMEERLHTASAVYAAGAASDRLLNILAASKEGCTLIVRDFTKLFISPEAFARFQRKGGSIRVLQRSKLVAITFNPTSPQGIVLDSEPSCRALSEALQIPVFDVMKIKT